MLFAFILMQNKHILTLYSNYQMVVAEKRNQRTLRETPLFSWPLICFVLMRVKRLNMRKFDINTQLDENVLLKNKLLRSECILIV